MEWITENWAIAFALICVVILVGENICVFIAEPNQKKMECVKQWLLYATIEAEKIYGSQTGQLKLRYVYNLAVEKFKWLPSLVDFETFSKWVDEALVWMKHQLEYNDAIKDYVEDNNNG